MADPFDHHRLLAVIIAAKREETGNPFWPFEPNWCGKSPEAIAEQEANIQITVAMRHNVGATEQNQRLEMAERLARRAGNEQLARNARKRRR